MGIKMELKFEGTQEHKDRADVKNRRNIAQK